MEDLYTVQLWTTAQLSRNILVTFSRKVIKSNMEIKNFSDLCFNVPYRSACFYLSTNYKICIFFYYQECSGSSHVFPFEMATYFKGCYLIHVYDLRDPRCVT